MVLDKLLRLGEGRMIKRLKRVAEYVNSLSDDIEKLTDAELQAKTPEFRKRHADGESLDDLLPEAFAVAREAAWRVLDQRHFDVQVMGGAALHFGNVAEMKTGEGKTLTSVLPAYLNGIGGKGVHVVTVNDYLAKRDSEWMGRVHRFLGLDVGVILSQMTPDERRVAYAADITYGTNNEFGFDYLRDNMAHTLEDCVQRGHNLAIVDEVDSILIDEARTPLIISGPADGSSNWYGEFARRQLRGQRLATLSELLPDIYGTVSETGAKIDLQTLGLSAGALGPTPLPVTVGPFHYYSALGNVEENLSLTSVYDLRQARVSAQAAEMSASNARELIVLAVGGTYLRVLAAEANVLSEEAQVKQAQATFKQSEDQFQAGTAPVIDRNRNLVEFHTEQQRLSSLRADVVKQTMQLARLIGLPVAQPITLSEELPPRVPNAPGIDDALKVAIEGRPDLKSAQLQLQTAQDAVRASKAEYLPSLQVNGNYGVEGINPDKGASVFQASASLRIPIFEGGRVKADLTQADAALTQRQAEYADQKGVVELEVRQAYVDLQVATEQIATATENRSVAAETLKQSLDRFGAGVTNSVEVVQSEETVASAERDYINSLLTLNLARISLAQASGQAEQFIPHMLKDN